MRHVVIKPSRLRSIAQFTLCVVMFVTNCPSVAKGEIKERPVTPEAVVLRYLELDGMGVRRTETVRKQMQKLTLSIVSVEDVPIAVDVSGVYRSYKIVSKYVDGGKAVITVEYQLIGTITNFAEFKRKDQSIRQNIELIRKDGDWYMVHSPLYRSWTAIVKKIRDLQQESWAYIEKIKEEKERKHERERLERTYIKKTNETIKVITELAKSR